MWKLEAQNYQGAKAYFYDSTKKGVIQSFDNEYSREGFRIFLTNIKTDVTFMYRVGFSNYKRS